MVQHCSEWAEEKAITVIATKESIYVLKKEVHKSVSLGITMQPGPTRG
jgi:hypothetical protein